jgi:hypothetical protein
MDFQTLAIGALILAALIFSSFIQRKVAKKMTEGEVDASAKLGLTPVTSSMTPDPRWQEVARLVGSGAVVAFGEMFGRTAYVGDHFSTAGQVRGGRTRIGMTEAHVYLALTATQKAPQILRIKQQVPALLQRKRPNEKVVLTGQPEFDERFEVFCNDETWALQVLDGATRGLLLAARRGVAGGKEDATGWAGAHTALFFGEILVVEDLVSYKWERKLGAEAIERLQIFAPMLDRLASRIESV